MTIMTKLAPPLRVDVPRDRWKRPTMTDPTTGERRVWQRVTTLAGMLDDTHNLTLWKMRQTAKGIAWRDDLRIAVATTDDKDNDGKRELDAICERAMDAAGASTGSAMGTAFHRVCQIAEAYPDVDPAAYCPPELRGELAAYRALVAEYRLTMSIDHQERTGICVETGTAGTWDDLTAGGPSCGCGRLHVVDKKSGQREFEYGQGKIAAQLAMYARFSSLWLATGGGYEAPPAICPEVGYVISVPIGRADDAVIYPVDLVAGWDRALFAVELREKRSVKRGLFGPALTLALPGTVAPTEMAEVEPAKPKRTRRTKAQIAADNEAAQHPGATKCAHGAWSDDETGCDECMVEAGFAVNETIAEAIAERSATGETSGNSLTRARLDAIGGDQARRAGASGETGTAHLMNGELKPGPVTVTTAELTQGQIDDGRTWRAGCATCDAVKRSREAGKTVPGCPHHEPAEVTEAAAVELLKTELGTEVVPATVERVRPDKAQLNREREAAYAGLRNGTTAQSELVAQNRHHVGRVVDVEMEMAPTVGAVTVPMPAKVALNVDSTIFGLVSSQNPDQLTHMCYGLDYAVPAEMVEHAETTGKGWMHFDAGTTCPEIKISAEELRRAFVALGLMASDEHAMLAEAIGQARGTADLETAYGLWSAHWTPEHDRMAVKRLISIVGTREGLDRIWETYQSVWTDDLTAAGNARLAELARL